MLIVTDLVNSIGGLWSIGLKLSECLNSLIGYAFEIRVELNCEISDGLVLTLSLLKGDTHYYPAISSS